MTKRNLFLIFIFSILTFGIYNIYWFAKTTKELNKKEQLSPITPYITVFLISLLLNSFIFFAEQSVHYQLAFFLISGIGYIYYHIWLYKFYRNVDTALNTNNKILSFVTSFFIPIIGIFITQNSMNKLD